MARFHKRHLFISEIRTINADDFWMSPCYKRTCVALHTTWKQEPEAVMNLLPLIEEQLAPFNARPHWAKLFTIAPAILQSRYEKLADFRQLAKEFDPGRKFQNEFLRSIFIVNSLRVNCSSYVWNNGDRMRHPS